MSHKKTYRLSTKNQRDRQGFDLSRQKQALLEALDGYSNAAAFLGEDSPLLSSGS